MPDPSLLSLLRETVGILRQDFRLDQAIMSATNLINPGCRIMNDELRAVGELLSEKKKKVVHSHQV